MHVSAFDFHNLEAPKKLKQTGSFQGELFGYRKVTEDNLEQKAEK
jgi:hypothetical protein